MTARSKWDLLYDGTTKPLWEDISTYINDPLWEELNDYLKEVYVVKPELSYSVCAAQRGWNVKYKKGGRALCTLYPEKGSFIALVVVGSREEMTVEMMLPVFSDDVRKLYENTRSMAMGRWLMIRVANRKILDDVKKLINIRVKPTVQ